MLLNKEQLYQNFWQSFKEQKFKAKKIEGAWTLLVVTWQMFDLFWYLRVHLT